jgi:hypothetical protein
MRLRCVSDMSKLIDLSFHRVRACRWNSAETERCKNGQGMVIFSRRRPPAWAPGDSRPFAARTSNRWLRIYDERRIAGAEKRAMHRHSFWDAPYIEPLL